MSTRHPRTERNTSDVDDQRLVEYRGPWGRFLVSDGTYGSRDTSLIVFPPDTTERERSWLRIWDSWHLAAIFTTLALFVVLIWCDAPAAVVVGAPVAIGVIGTIVLARIAGPQRSKIVKECVSESLLVPDPADLQRSERLQAFGRLLIDADRSSARGELTPDEYLETWRSIHSALALRQESVSFPPAPVRRSQGSAMRPDARRILDR